MSERRCPGCSSLLQPGFLHCAGCGRFRYTGLRKLAVALILAAAAYFALRYLRR